LSSRHLFVAELPVAALEMVVLKLVPVLA